MRKDFYVLLTVGTVLAAACSVGPAGYTACCTRSPDTAQIRALSPRRNPGLGEEAPAQRGVDSVAGVEPL